jgi:hypothetical protein
VSRTLHKRLEPLFERFRDYDRRRLKLEREGGSIQDLQQIREVLQSPVTLTGCGRRERVTLEGQDDLCWAVRTVGDYALRLTVRVLDTGMPAYYLCRVHSDFWTDYVLVLEDLYMSPGYPLIDERFVKLMRSGRDTFHLRLAPLRPLAAAHLEDCGEEGSATDRILKRIGKNVLQAAWHEDQRPGLLVAEHLDIPELRDAIELIYLVLSADLCYLRSIVDDDMMAFFTNVYPQPAIRTGLSMLTRLDGAELNELPDRALRLYARLSNSFSNLLHTEALWGETQVTMPLYKLVFANFTRMAEVGRTLSTTPAVREAADALRLDAEQIIADVVAQGTG